MKREDKRKEYMDKRTTLERYCGSAVSSMDFYYDLFPWMSFEVKGWDDTERKPNGILTRITLQRTNPIAELKGEYSVSGQSLLVYDDHETIQQVQGEPFVIMPPVSYFGKAAKRRKKNARQLFAIAIDLDGTTVENIKNVLWQAGCIRRRDDDPNSPFIDKPIIPRPTYIVFSGHGLHLYYMFKEPIDLYHHRHNKLNNFKHALTAEIWNNGTTTIPHKDMQFQGIFQGFRMPGTLSKLGKGYPVMAFKTGVKVDIDYLNSFIHMEPENKITDLDWHSKLTLEQAKEKYPDWYQWRIVEGKKPEKQRWHIKKDLYNWGLRKIKEEGKAGHRYHCIKMLACLAVKCDVPRDEAYKDALSLLEHFDQIKRDERDIFTENDIKAAFMCFRESYVNFSRESAEHETGIPMPPQKRNKRKQELHLKIARTTRDILHPEGWQNKEGAPTKEYMVKQWRACYPDGTKKQCQEDTGLSRPTIIKWWGEPPRKYETGLKLKGFSMAENARRTQRGEFPIPEFDNK